MTNRGTLHVLVGPVGAGKTTYGRRRAAQRNAMFLNLDAWMVRLFGADPRPSEGVMAWYLERRERCRGLLWAVALDALDSGVDVFVEMGLIHRAERERLYQSIDAEGLASRVYLLDAPRDVRRARVEARNASAEPLTQQVPAPFFELASDAWEAPDDEERAARQIIDA